MRLKKLPAGTLLLAGLAVFAYYRYSRLSEEQKNNLRVKLKERRERFYSRYVPRGIKNLFIEKENMFYDDNFGEHSDYSF